MRRRRPADRMLSGVAKIFPRKFFSAFRAQLALISQFLLAHVRLRHHFFDQILHIYDWLNKIRIFYPHAPQGMHSKNAPISFATIVADVRLLRIGSKKRYKFLFRLARRASLVIKSERVAIRKKRLVAGCFFLAFVFGVYI